MDTKETSKMNVKHINLIAPVYDTKYLGNEGRLVRWLDSDEGLKLSIDLCITDLRKYPDSEVNLKGSYDATIVFKGEMLTPDRLKKCSRPLILYFPDDILVYPGYAKFVQYIGKCYDKIFVFDKESIQSFYNLGCKDVEWLPSWTGTDLFYNKGLDRDIDICFIGSFNKRRLEMMDLIKVNFKDKKLCFKENIYGEEYVELMNRSKIVINMAQSMTSGISQRVFEATACGALVITNYCKELFLLFSKDQIISWNTIKELLKLLHFYLDNNDLREDIALKGYKQTLENHLVQHRFKVMIDYIKEWKVKEGTM